MTETEYIDNLVFIAIHHSEKRKPDGFYQAIAKCYRYHQGGQTPVKDLTHDLNEAITTIQAITT